MIRKLTLTVGLAVFLNACGHKPLKAPCEPGDAQPLSSFIAASLPDAFNALVPFVAECGPLHRL
jgi:hypothetical protein